MDAIFVEIFSTNYRFGGKHIRIRGPGNGSINKKSDQNHAKKYLKIKKSRHLNSQA